MRVLQYGEIQKVGADKTTVVDVRVVAAIHKDLQRSVAEGRFREDLFYRLNVVPLHLPSLRERKDDIPLLTQFILARLCLKHNMKSKPLDDEALIELQQYSWPGMYANSATFWSGRSS